VLLAASKRRISTRPQRSGAESTNPPNKLKSGTIVYMPPESKDVQSLMRHLVVWLKESGDFKPRMLEQWGVVRS
jgi:Fic family protein